MPARTPAALVPARAGFGWSFRNTITFWLTCCDSWAACAADSGCWAWPAAEVTTGAATAVAACATTSVAADAPTKRTERAPRLAFGPGAAAAKRPRMIFLTFDGSQTGRTVSRPQRGTLAEPRRC